MNSPGTSLRGGCALGADEYSDQTPCSSTERDSARLSGSEGASASGASLALTLVSAATDVRSRAPVIASVRLGADEPLELTVFVDRSVVDVFVNDHHGVAARVYPDREDSTSISLRSQGSVAELKALDAW